MNLSTSIKSIVTGLYLSLKRFPVTILLSVSIAAILIAISEVRPTDDTLSKVGLILALGIPLSLSIKLFFEKIDMENTYKLFIAYGAGALFLMLYYLFFLTDMEMVSMTRYIATSLALYLTFLFTPYFPRRNQFEKYSITLLTGFFTTFVYSIVLYAGLSAILFTINKLLGVQILGKVYYYTWLFVVFIFAVSYFLSGIPLKNKDLTLNPYPKLLRILILYIVMPLLTAYTIILYIYFGKIIITTQWPVGLVSHLVLWYSVILAIVIFFITPLQSENSWANKFSKFAPKIVLPLLIMMFISICIRIKAYGVTEPRYYVVILALWVFSVMLYFSLRKTVNNIVILVALALVCLFSVFGPISSYSISKYSQNQRLEKILIENNMLKDGTIQTSKDISKKDRGNISSILDYFNRNHSLSEVKHLPQNFKLEDMNKVFGFSYETPATLGPKDYYYFIRSSDDKAIDISGYDYLFDMRSLMGTNSPLNNDIKATYNYDGASIKISYKDKDVYSKDLTPFIQDMINKHISEGRETILSSDEMTLIDENEKIKVKFIFQNMSGSRSESNETLGNNGLEFYLMVKIK